VKIWRTTGGRRTEHARRLHHGVALTAFIAGALALAACGSSSSSSSPTSSGASGTASAKSVIKLGVLASFTGVEAASIGPSRAAIESWAKAVNDAGGLNGHHIDLIVKDDAGNVSNAVVDAKGLIQNDHVIAILNDVSLGDSKWGTLAQQAQVPVLGGSGQAEFSANPDFFTAGTSFAPLVGVAVKAAAEKGETKIAVPYCAEVAPCAQAAALVAAVGKPVGSTVTWTGKFSGTATDYTAQCLAAKNSGANAMFVSAGSDGVIRFASGCASQGYSPIQVTADGTLTDDWLPVKALNGSLAAEQNAPWFDTSTPATQEFHAAMQKYAPSAKLSAASIAAWASGKLFEAAYKAAGSPDTVTSADVLKGLYALHDETLGGISPPLNYTPGKVANITCAFIVGIKDGKFVAPQKLTTTCVS
jgi:branched-chain amino acid transport system substrate-binding protein